MNRRDFCKFSVLGAGLFSLPVSLKAKSILDGWLTGFKDHEGRFGVAHISSDLESDILFYSPVRLHNIQKHPHQNIIVAPARRPGTELFVFDLVSKAIKVIPAENGRHFYGHSIFSPDGDYLYATENAYDDEYGVIGVYEVHSGFKRIGEYKSGGIGPHELAYFDHQLIVCNGGILTHPETGRSTLNLDSMKPNVSILYSKTGRIIQQTELSNEYRHLSMRHMDILSDGTVIVGMQDQIPNRYDMPLVWSFKNLTALPLTEPKQGWKVFKGYVGSVATSGQEISVSSPRGNLVHHWRVDGALESIKIKDVCGISYAKSQSLIMTDGRGGIRLGNGKELISDTLHFDNHCSLIA